MAEFGDFTGCGDLVNGRASQRMLHELRFDKRNLAEVWQNGQWFYVNRGGKAIRVFTFDNGPDYFSEGLTRSETENKITFFSSALQPILVTPYTWASPFVKGCSVVCVGCRSVPMHAGSEYQTMKGGRWGIIDRSGREVLPLSAENAHKSDLYVHSCSRVARHEHSSE